ncbi:MAG: SPFH domain-containing protein [Candidatus Nanopelagicales bacterium]
MSTGAKVVLALIVVPILATFLWSLLRQSIVAIPTGKLGVLVVRGKPTDRVLLPGPHWVPALRKRTAVQYPSIEMSLRATDAPGAASAGPTEAFGPALRVTLGDRAEAVVGYTVRFRLDPERLRSVHDRFGPDGIWAVCRDDSGRAIAGELADPGISLEDLFGSARADLEARLGRAVSAALGADGIVLTSFSLGAVDLGRTGQVIQAVVRARLELEREEAESAMRLARARHDAELAPQLVGVGEAALRYRQTDLWRDLIGRSEAVALALPGMGDSLPGMPEAGSRPAEPEPVAPAEPVSGGAA